ncbi:MAG: amidohydrolase [Burkholderiaceae bacterium]
MPADSPTIVFRARAIHTLNPIQPLATHVAVRDGRIVGVGDAAALAAWGPCDLDTRFDDAVLLPGFVEGHSHTSEGAFWQSVYCGYFERTDPDGRRWPGVRDSAALVERLRQAQATLDDPEAPLSGWALDPIYYPGGEPPVTRALLDQVSDTRPIGLMHASGHILSLNTPALRLAGLLREGIEHPGIALGTDGLPTGELKGPETMTPAGRFVGFDRERQAADAGALRAFGRVCVRAGVTTATDLANLLPDEAVRMMLAVTAQEDFPARVVSFRRFHAQTPAQLIARVRELAPLSTDKLRLGGAKLFADGSIQGFSARLRWPGYHNGAPNGLWYVNPDHLREALVLALRHGVPVQIHTNGDEAVDMVLDTMQQALREQPGADHRFTLQHAQLADAGQFRRMRALGLCVNLFPNHLYYWGEQHAAMTVGPDRAARMNACASALAEGVPMAMHSDAPVTPMAPLFTAWCAVNRLDAHGRVMGAGERISVPQALRAITLGAAYTLHMDHEVGSIECGKRADFAVLLDDPTTIAPERLRETRVWGTVLGGRAFAAGA